MTDLLVDAMIRRVSNWGRWGADDQLGTVNFITDRVRAGAAECVRVGRTFSLSLPLSRSGPQRPGDTRLNPHHVMLQTGTELAAGVQPGSIDGWGYADDMVTMALQCATHWDGLSHAFYDYKLYNDRPCTDVTCDGAQHCGIEHHAAAGVVTRGVLVDVARSLGVDHLPLDHEITVHEIEAALERQRVEVRSGDALLFRTGNLARARAHGGWDRLTHGDEPGLGLEALPWLHEHEIAAVAADTWAFEAIPNPSSIMLPLHAAGIVHMGLLVGEMFELEALALDCERDGRYTFLLGAQPLPFVGAVGSPVNPVAVK
jgi:kynurenine formamidase